MRRVSLAPVSWYVGERVGDMETPSTVMGSRTWSFRTIHVLQPMKAPLPQRRASAGILLNRRASLVNMAAAGVSRV